MPEGDTIFRAARTLNEALSGRTVTNFETVLPRLSRVDDQKPIAGRRIERVFAAGKHLIIDFSGGLHLRTHMRMNGSWHVYRRGERWHRSRADMRIVIGTHDWVAVGFNVPVAEFLDDRGLSRQADLARLGPDLAAAAFDENEAARRILERRDHEIANVLLNQRVVAGLGNVFKSEVLFVCNVNPFTRVAELSDDTVAKIVRKSRKLLELNIAPDAAPGRVTRASLDKAQKLWVYGRGGKPCRKCGTKIEYRKQGLDARGTYWCPRCQLKIEN